MNMGRTFIKKFIYRFLGEKVYKRAYIRAKINDIKTANNAEPELKMLPHFIRINSTVIDVGANYGHYSVEMAKLCPNGRVLAFEPVPFTYDVLVEVINAFRFSNIETVHAAVSNISGQVEMTVPLLEFGAPNTGVAHIGKAEDNNSKTVIVECIVLDELNVVENVDFIKIDVEGHEPLALQGMEKLIERYKPVILIEFSHSCLRRAGFDPNDFAITISEKLKYEFTVLDETALEYVSTKNPVDGYYFLIPREKMSNFRSIIKS